VPLTQVTVPPMPMSRPALPRRTVVLFVPEGGPALVLPENAGKPRGFFGRGGWSCDRVEGLIMYCSIRSSTKQVLADRTHHR